MRRFASVFAVISVLLVIALGFAMYRYWWTYYRLFYSNGAGDLTYEQRAEALARGGEQALYMMGLRITDETPGADALALDALEIMHSDSLHGPGILYRWMADGNQDAMSMVTFIALRGRLDRSRHVRLYRELGPDRVVAAVEDYVARYSKPDADDLGRRAIAALRAERQSLVEAERVRRFTPSLPPPLRSDLQTRLLAERKRQPQDQLLAFDRDGQFLGTRSMLLLSYVDLFTSFCSSHPSLTDEQIFEVASILANDVSINARYFFEYRNGQPQESRVIENPGYDFRHTGDNLPTVTP
jgi:hypothetical protein